MGVRRYDRQIRSLDDARRALQQMGLRQVNVIPDGAIDGVNDEFDLPGVAIQDTLAVYLDGVRQQEATDYTLSVVNNRTRITFASPPAGGSWIVVDYFE